MLPKKNRISKKDFPSYKNQGFRAYSPFFSAVFYQTGDSSVGSEIRAAVVVSKKTAKTAVVRNKLRRMFYSLLAACVKNTSTKTTVVVYPKVGSDKVEYVVLEKEVEKIFKQAKIEKKK